MIGKISGIIDYCSKDHILVDVQGVGYTIFISEKTSGLLPEPGNKVALFTELVVREDLLQLIGFTTLVEREWYRLLTSVQGVGSKAALAILGLLSSQALSRAITLGDVDAIKSAQGIGPKIAQRVVLELKEKVLDLMSLHSQEQFDTFHDEAKTSGDNFLELQDSSFGQTNKENKNASQNQVKLELDAISALVNLGYSQIDASIVVAKELMILREDANLSNLIQAALKRIAPKGIK